MLKDIVKSCYDSAVEKQKAEGYIVLERGLASTHATFGLVSCPSGCHRLTPPQRETYTLDTDTDTVANKERTQGLGATPAMQWRREDSDPRLTNSRC